MVVTIGFKNGTNIELECEKMALRQEILGSPTCIIDEGETLVYVDMSSVDFILREDRELEVDEE